MTSDKACPYHLKHKALLYVRQSSAHQVLQNRESSALFERMVAEVCLCKVGAVCARKVSRFARNSRDWQQLIEMRRVVDTILIDQETVYHAAMRQRSAAAWAQGKPQRV